MNKIYNRSRDKGTPLLYPSYLKSVPQVYRGAFDDSCVDYQGIVDVDEERNFLLSAHTLQLDSL